MTMMSTPVTETPAAPRVTRGFLIEIGESVFPVYGDATIGWSIDRRDIVDATPYRYATLDELIFVLVNYSVHSGGDA
jgi:hypothetical protein